MLLMLSRQYERLLTAAPELDALTSLDAPALTSGPGILHLD